MKRRLSVVWMMAASLFALSATPARILVPEEILVDEDSPKEVSIAIEDDDGSPADVSINSIKRGNPVLFGSGDVSISGLGRRRTMTLRPRPNQSGTSTVTLIAKDAGFEDTTITFTVVVRDINDLPEVGSLGTPPQISVGARGRVAFNRPRGGPGAEQEQPMTAQLTVSTPGVIDLEALHLEEEPGAPQIFFKGVGSGTTLVTLTLTDTGEPPLSFSRSFEVKVVNPRELRVSLLNGPSGPALVYPAQNLHNYVVERSDDGGATFVPTAEGQRTALEGTIEFPLSLNAETALFRVTDTGMDDVDHVFDWQPSQP